MAFVFICLQLITDQALVRKCQCALMRTKTIWHAPLKLHPVIGERAVTDSPSASLTTVIRNQWQVNVIQCLVKMSKVTRFVYAKDPNVFQETRNH